MSATDDQKRDFEVHFQQFFEELKSILELEDEGEISSESVLKIRNLLAEFWKLKA